MCVNHETRLCKDILNDDVSLLPLTHCFIIHVAGFLNLANDAIVSQFRILQNDVIVNDFRIHTNSIDKIIREILIRTIEVFVSENRIRANEAQQGPITLITWSRTLENLTQILFIGPSLTQVEESAQIPLKKMQEMTGMSGIWPEWAESIKKKCKKWAEFERNKKCKEWAEFERKKNARNERNLIGIKNAGNERNLTWPNERKHWNSRNRESMYTKYVKKVQVNLLEPISGKFSPEQVQAWLSEKFYIEQWKLVFLQK